MKRCENDGSRLLSFQKFWAANSWLSLQLRADPINISNLQFLLVSTRLIIEAAMYEENRIVTAFNSD